MVLIVAYRAHQTTANQGIKPVTQATVIQLGPSKSSLHSVPSDVTRNPASLHLHHQGSSRTVESFQPQTGCLDLVPARPRPRFSISAVRNLNADKRPALWAKRGRTGSIRKVLATKTSRRKPLPQRGRRNRAGPDRSGGRLCRGLTRISEIGRVDGGAQRQAAGAAVRGRPSSATTARRSASPRRPPYPDERKSSAWLVMSVKRHHHGIG